MKFLVSLFIRFLPVYRPAWAALPAHSGCGSQKELDFGAERIKDGGSDKVGQ